MSVAYSGAAVLETMAEARNYNRFLADLVAGSLGGCRSVVDFGAGDGTSCSASISSAGALILARAAPRPHALKLPCVSWSRIVASSARGGLTKP